MAYKDEIWRNGCEMTDAAGAAEPTPLEERLVNLIKLKGPITVADYMADALGHPHDGYYMSQTPIGADGDFITAPEISQTFGELIGLWLVEAWRAMGSPTDFNLIELGPGRGVLMEDVLRAARLRPEFIRGAHLWLLETSGRLRVEQQKRLRGAGLDPMWADEFADIPPAPSLIVANEFFDCLPIHQYQRVRSGWRERMVGLNDDETRLEFVLGKTPPPATLNLPATSASKEGDIAEISFAARDFIADLSDLLAKHGGQALIIDYGHMQSGMGETLQAVRAHKFWPPLASPGRADVTAHVDFEALGAAVIDHGAVAHGPVSQGEFLERLGLNIRVEMLCKGKTAKQAKTIRAGAYRIASPDQMGEIFKVMCICAPSLPAPSGFEDI
jgi:NADH dehydrogenase [ubiquinone] 1 alpha subcomplex assembly factor 7